MRTIALPPVLLAPVLLVLSAQAPPPKPGAVLAPSEIVAAAPAADWVTIAASDLLVMDLAPDRDGNARRVVIQLMPPPFSQGWVGNVRLLAAAHWWDGLSINRVQDNYVVQWGDADGEDKAKAKKLPPGLVTVQERDYDVGAQQFLQRDGFFKEGLCANLDSVDRCVDGGVATHHDDRHVEQTRGGPLFQEAHTIGVGHPDVQQHQVGAHAMPRLSGHGGVLCQLHLMAFVKQDF
jgi:hypothetical protein